MTTNAALANSDIGKRILLSRRDLNWGQDELAASSGVSRGYISNIERGRITNIGIEVLKALAAALGVSPAYLMGLTDNPLAGVDDEEETLTLRETRPAYITDPTTTELLTLIDGMTSSQRAQLVSIARVLAGSPHIIG